MKIKFQKYQGTGNDFIIINNNKLNFPELDSDLIKKLCSRKFGVGSDGLILINPSKNTDFEMIYFNSDGKLGSLCGNGARCSVMFGYENKIIHSKTIFSSCQGNHKATIINNNIFLNMLDVDDLQLYKNDILLNTGSPHYVKIVQDLENYDVLHNGKKIRNSPDFKSNGINVNFVQKISEDTFKVRTYERGVENETLSCGTGATASAIAMNFLKKTNSEKIKIKTIGGDLNVKFNTNNKSYKNIELSGHVSKVFNGEIKI
tara:strand:+ start:754 stop:1533 length:780 start_codon:yes stop_codon:yes gene_type:complete